MNHKISTKAVKFKQRVKRSAEKLLVAIILRKGWQNVFLPREERDPELCGQNPLFRKTRIELQASGCRVPRPGLVLRNRGGKG